MTRLTALGKVGPAYYGAYEHDADWSYAVLNATGENQAKDMSAFLRRAGLKKDATATAGDASLEEERKTFTKDGEKVTGFASSVVPTLEEKVVAEQRPPPERTVAGDHSQSVDTQGHQSGDADQQHGDATNASRQSDEGRVDGELYGAPANADTQHDDQPPVAQGKDSDEAEDKAPESRSILRKNLMSKLGSKTGRGTYSIPTPTPYVDPQGFEDPICDEFWKDTWAACAAHNVNIFPHLPFKYL